ncbi:thioredoxin family protein [Arcicella sp. DC2W]|uniref:Thioredoxin family protein n=1 Tax=Arcicella gelida TaxID=2984195 RepID=A0ABU5RYL1_9BACT|nr:thioredoxin family protein [Arcicella sp. DC2W]MEA5401311.1 thioredoxin family protein [Arcicella sp. DC2W]
MKKFFILSLFVFLTHLVTAQKGTAFLQSGNLKTVFDLAKAQNKPVHLEVYAPTCHVCNAFKPTFENAQVGSLYNQNFVNYKLDITSAEGAAFLNKQGIWIPSTPTLLFFDKDVKLMHITVLGENYNTPQALIEAANKALDPKQRTSNYKASYRSGNRDANFLIEYGFMARIMRDTLDNINVMNNYAKIVPATQYGNNTSFLLLQKVIMDDENDIFEYMISHLGEFNAKYDKNLVKQTAENIIMYSLYSSRGSKYSVAKINKVRANLAKLGVDKKSINGRVWREESTAYFREGQVPKALAVLDSLVDATTDKKSYKFLSNWIKARSSDKAALAKAALWDAKSK